MSKSRRRAKTATIAFPILNGVDRSSRDGFSNNAVFPDYLFLRPPPSTNPEYSTQPPSHSKFEFCNPIISRTKGPSVAKSTSNLFNYPLPPPLNPKLKILKKIMSTNTRVAQGSGSSTLRYPAERDTAEAPIHTHPEPLTPILPPKLRTLKSRTGKLSSPRVKKRSSHKSIGGMGMGAALNENMLEALPSLQLLAAPASKNLPSDEMFVFSEKQKFRTWEERAENPESLHLDKAGLKQFPFLGSEESHLKLLSLQHNLICRLEGLPSLNHLLVLDLYNNRVERITGLQVFHSLRVLLLGKNRIRRIEGLDGLKRLEILDLHGNQLRYIDNLASLVSLRVLNLAGNLIRSIRNLGPYGLSTLTELNLKRNRIKNLDGLQKAPHLRKLLLANNELQSISALYPLRKMLYLQELMLDSNPISSLPEYTSQVLTIFSWLSILDKVTVTDQMRLDAKGWHRRRIAQNAERRKEQEKFRLTAASTREEIIHEAQRRWESVKKFVRHPHGTYVDPDYEKDQDGLQLADENHRSSLTFRRAKSETRTAESAYELDVEALRRFPISAEIGDSMQTSRDISPFHVRSGRKNYNREESVVTTMTKSIDLKKREQDTRNRSAERIADPCIISVDSRPTNRISKGTQLESAQAEAPETKSIQKLTKLAVVRPLVRTNPDPGQQSSTSEMKSDDIFQRTVQSSSAVSETQWSPPLENEPIKITATEAEVSTEIRNEKSTICLASRNDAPTDMSETVRSDERPSPRKIMDSNEALCSESIPVLADNIEVLKPDEVLEDKLANSSTLPDDAAPAVYRIPKLENRPIFRRSFSSCVLSGVPPALGALNGNSSGSSSATSSNINISGIKPAEVENVENYLVGAGSSRVGQVSMKTELSSLRSSSVDAQLPTSDTDTFDVESVAASTNAGSEVGTRRPAHRSLFPRRAQLKRGQTARTRRSSSATVSMRRPVTGIQENKIGNSPLGSGRAFKRRESTPVIESYTSDVLKKQGADYLVEMDGKVLSLYGQGALKHMLTGFPMALISSINMVKFHFVTYDTIIPYFGKLRQTYPSLEHVQFRANNISILAQLNALADLQGIFSLNISKEGNPVVDNEVWQHYAIYRLAHWGLQQINGKEISSEYRGEAVSDEFKIFESLGYLALSCLPQSTLTPLAKKLHTLHCFCCCSPSSSSDESGRRKAGSNGDADSSGNNCTSWDDDPVLLDVIGKEALVYVQHKEELDPTYEVAREVGIKIVTKGREMIEKLDMLETLWPALMSDVVEEILIDYLCMDNYMKKALKKVKDLSMISHAKKSKP